MVELADPTAIVNNPHLVPPLHTHLQPVHGGSTAIASGSHGYTMVLIVGARTRDDNFTCGCGYPT
jgi:hypothetical protein